MKGQKEEREGRQVGGREGGMEGSREEDLTPTPLWEIVSMLLKQKQGTEYIEDFHVNNDAELDKGSISGWRDTYLRYILEMQTDGLVNGLAMNINGTLQGRIYFFKSK